MTDRILSFSTGQRTLRPAGTYTAAIDRLRRNGVGARGGSSRSGPPPHTPGSPAASAAPLLRMAA